MKNIFIHKHRLGANWLGSSFTENVLGEWTRVDYKPAMYSKEVNVCWAALGRTLPSGQGKWSFPSVRPWCDSYAQVVQQWHKLNRGWGVSITGDNQTVTACGPEQPAVAGSTWTRGWTRCCPKASVNLSALWFCDFLKISFFNIFPSNCSCWEAISFSECLSDTAVRYNMLLFQELE